MRRGCIAARCTFFFYKMLQLKNAEGLDKGAFICIIIKGNYLR